MKSHVTFPFFVKASVVCIGFYVLVSILSIGQTIIVPLILSSIVAVLLSPVVNFLVRKGFNRILAIIITVLLLLCISGFLTVLLSKQIIEFAHSVPQFILKLEELLAQFSTLIAENFNLATNEVDEWLLKEKGQLIEESTGAMGQTLIKTGSKLVLIILIPIYIFMFLVYQPLLIEFIHRLFSEDNQKNVNEVISNIKKVIQSYLVGLLFEAVIVAILYSIALLILGIDYAILLAVIGALLNLIPYLGAIIAASLPMMIALTTKPPSYALLILGAYVLIQIIDNNFIIPKVVSSRVRINALVSIIIVIAGGMLWGIPGMFLAIPMTAILKVICDHVDSLKPLGFVLGDTSSSLLTPMLSKLKIKKD